MSAKHTKGPWTLSKSYGTAANHAVCAGPANIIAKVTGFGYPSGQGSSPESLANARLIAAAPELLEALEKAEATIAVLKTFCTTPLTVVRAAETEHQIARAIAKARIE